MTNQVKGRKLSRRDFLKLAGATGVAVPALVGLNLLYDSRGNLPGGYDPDENTRTLDSGAASDQPILLLHNDLGENPFGAYLGEILLAEGINSFNVVKLSDMDFDSLSEQDIVILTDGPLDQKQADGLSRYVFNGGSLVVMNPDSALLPILGLKDQQTTSEQKYIVTDSGHELAAGIAPVSLQYHSVARNYLPDSTQVIAWLCDKPGEEKDYPAVSLNKYGDGWVCAWAYDLVKSIVLTRQGNPEWANQERDGFDGIRPSDMFHDWLDLDRIEIPQADEQQRLLVNVINFLSQNKRPLPRLWYFPNKSKSMFIATSDAHQNPGWAMESVIQHVEKFDGYISIYSLPPFYTVPYRAAQKVRWWLEDLSVMDKAYFPSPSRVADWRARGHEFGIHPIVENGFEAGWEENWKRFTGGGYGPVPPTTRVHRILWDGWMESAKLQEGYGFGMNFDYYHVGDAFQKNTGEWVYGHFTGSGLPMKFIDENGRIINLYQQLTQLADDHLLELHWGGSVKLPAEKAVQISRSMIDRSLRGGYAAIGAIFHTDPFAEGEAWAAEESKWMDGTLEYAADKDIPIWSGEMWLNFVESRHDTFMGNILWNSDTKILSFTANTYNLKFGSMSILLPMEHSQFVLSGVEVNGQAVEYNQQSLGSTSYACFSLRAEMVKIMAYFV